MSFLSGLLRKSTSKKVTVIIFGWDETRLLGHGNPTENDLLGKSCGHLHIHSHWPLTNLDLPKGKQNKLEFQEIEQFMRIKNYSSGLEE
jgi:hypothetical protein